MRVFVVGAKSQALLSYHILARAGHSVPYVFDSDRTVPKPPWDCVLLHEENDLDDYARKCDGFLICIANIGRGQVRLRYARRLETLGILPVSAIHPTTFIAETAKIGRGFQTFPRAVVGEFATIGDYSIVGINAAIDHECIVGNGCHVMGGAAIAGDVTINDGSEIGANATVLPHITVGKNSIVGAGAVVTKDVPDNVVVTGVPAKILRSR
jgi:sugar O-acyltransferase (sialic acid O-acetyltransferase NeuD family)